MPTSSVRKWGKTVCSGGGVVSGVPLCGGGKEEADAGYTGGWEVGAGTGKSGKSG